MGRQHTSGSSAWDRPSEATQTPHEFTTVQFFIALMAWSGAYTCIVAQSATVLQRKLFPSERWSHRGLHVLVYIVHQETKFPVATTSNFDE